MGRVNTVTNKPYNQDPTIMGWVCPYALAYVLQHAPFKAGITAAILIWIWDYEQLLLFVFL